MTNPFKVLPTAALLAGMAFAGPGIAQALPPNASLALLCPPPNVQSAVAFHLPCVYDSHQQAIGLATGDGFLLRPEAGQWFKLYYNSVGLLDFFFYYAGPNCSSQPPYFLSGGDTPEIQLPEEAGYDGTQIWAPIGTPTTTTIGSYKDALSGQCGNFTSDPHITPETFVAQPAVAVATIKIYPPLSIE